MKKDNILDRFMKIYTNNTSRSLNLFTDWLPETEQEVDIKQSQSRNNDIEE